MSMITATRPVSPSQLQWLSGEVAAWRAEGLVDEGQASAILGRYQPSRRNVLARLLLGLGGSFVGVGLIWLVAANLDELSPVARFATIGLIWLALLAGGELLATRRVHGVGVAPPVVGAVRIMAALAFGAVVFQAAQSLQVPAFAPVLLGCWSLGALVHAYAVRGTGPLVVGVLAGAGYVLWEAMERQPSSSAVVLALLAAGVLAASMAALHDRGDLPGFGAVWREVGAALALAGLFVAAVPYAGTDGFSMSPWFVVVLAVAGVAATAAMALAPGRARLEPLAVLAMSAVAWLLLVWEAGADASTVSAVDWAHAAVSVLAYVAAAIWVAVLGIVRDSWRLTAISLGSVVVFTTFQSFAVFAAIIDGAWLFVVLGLVLLGTGVGFDRARRRLAATLEGEAA